MFRILHVEDDHLQREHLLDLMRQIAIVQPALSVAEAQREYKPGVFDLVICDGTLQKKHDGVYYAVFLARLGQNVLVLSADQNALDIAQRNQLPSLHKLDGLNSIDLAVRKLLGLT